MLMIKTLYEEFKQNEQSNNDSLMVRLRLKQGMPRMHSVGVYKSNEQGVFDICARTIDGNDVPENYGGPIDGNAIEFRAMGFIRGYCADSGEAYNAFLEKINGKEAETWI